MKFQELTSPKIAGLDRKRTVVIIPIAAVEQHGPHMPTGTDTILCTAMGEALEEKNREEILLLPTQWLGASSHHLRFGATVSAELETYIATLCETAVSLLEDGFQRILFLNGHGGNIDPMRVAIRELQPEYPNALLVAGCYWSVADDLINEHLEGDHKFVGHACEFETSLMLHVRPDLVDQGKIANAGELIPDSIGGFFVGRDMMQRTDEGFTGRPDLATEEKGEALFLGIVGELVDLIRTLQAQPLGITYDEFKGFT